MERDQGAKKNQGPTHPADNSDLLAFQSGYRRMGTPAWWRQNLDLEKYFSYRAIVEAVHHYDIGHGKNYYYYHNPLTGRWQVHPWDVDLTWDNAHYGDGDHLFSMAVAERREFRAEYYNRIQEVTDLLYNEEQTGMLIDEWAGFIQKSDQLGMSGADAALWNYHPENQAPGAYYQLPSLRRLPPNLSGFVQKMKGYIRERQRFMAYLTKREALRAPPKPSLAYAGPSGHPADGLTFHLKAPKTANAAHSIDAVAWRLAEVTLPTAPGFDAQRPRLYEIDPSWESGVIDKGDRSSITIPEAIARPGSRYRARVRSRNNDGFWSPWSDPITFVAGYSRKAPLARHRLVLREIMYHPPASNQEVEEHQESDYEYLVIANISPEVVPLDGLAFDKGITFQFAQATQKALGPGEALYLVANQSAFRERYGAKPPVGGVFEGKLDNGGERLRVVDDQDQIILDVRYDDDAPWPSAADGRGVALQRADLRGDGNRARSWMTVQ